MKVISQTCWYTPPLILWSLHIPVFSVSHNVTRHHHQRPTTLTPTSPPPKRWKFKLQMSLLFQIHLSHPKGFPRWMWNSKPPPPTLIILVMPNYDLMKTLTMSPTQEDCPPSYHLPPYTPSHRALPLMLLGKTTSFSSPLPPTTTLTTQKLRRSRRITAVKMMKVTQA